MSVNENEDKSANTNLEIKPILQDQKLLDQKSLSSKVTPISKQEYLPQDQDNSQATPVPKNQPRSLAQAFNQQSGQAGKENNLTKTQNQNTGQTKIEKKPTVEKKQDVSLNQTRNKNDNRRFYINQTEKNKKKYYYQDNFVRTSKYTIIDFVPKSLLLQFQRYANIYFLLIAILQSIPSISPLNPATAIAPLVFVLMVSMVREGFEDYERHVSDEKENMDKIERFQNNQFKEDLAKNIEVGEIIRVKEYSVIPADILLLSCSNLTKIAYIETANLDGEKNLKPKFCVPNVFGMYKDANEAIRIRGKILCDKPNSDLNKFNGRLKLSVKNEFTINIKQFLYKGNNYILIKGLSSKIQNGQLGLFFTPGKKLKSSSIRRKVLESSHILKDTSISSSV